MARLRAHVYVDGFNLYYRALKRARCNWLNLSALAKLYLPKCDVVAIKYFTADIVRALGTPTRSYDSKHTFERSGDHQGFILIEAEEGSVRSILG